MAWVEAEAEGGTSKDPAVAAAEGNGAGVALREDPVGGQYGGDRPGDLGEYRQRVDDRLDRMEERLERR